MGGAGRVRPTIRGRGEPLHPPPSVVIVLAAIARPLRARSSSAKRRAGRHAPSPPLAGRSIDGDCRACQNRSMSTALATATQPIARELHSALLALDPARFDDTKRAELAARLAGVRDRFTALLESADRDAVAERLAALAEVLRAKLPDPNAARERWMRLRDELQPSYEALVVALRDHAVHVPSLRPTNYVRNVFHVVNALGVVALVELVPMPIVRWIASGAFALVVFLESIRRLSPRANAVIMKVFGAVAHPYEHYRVNSGTWYVAALFVLAWLGRADVGAAAVAVLGLADPAASLVGRRFGRTKLLHGRTLEGSATFVLVGFAAAIAVFRAFHPELGWGVTLAGAAAAALAGAIAEALSRRVDDNFSIPVIAAAAAWGVLTVL